MTKNSTTDKSIELVEALRELFEQERPEAQLPAGALNYDMRAVASAVGLRVALDIMLALGGSTLYVPRPEELLRWLRDQRIRREYAAGGRVKAICHKYGLTERTVYKVLKGPPDRGPALAEGPEGSQQK